MDAATLQTFFGWCCVLNTGLLLWWAFFVMFASGFTYRMHTRWFPMPRERFSEIHYALIAQFKLAVFVLNVVPYFALVIMAG